SNPVNSTSINAQPLTMACCNGGFSSSFDILSFILRFVFQIKFCGNFQPHRQAACYRAFKKCPTLYAYPSDKKDSPFYTPYPLHSELCHQMSIGHTYS